MWVLALFLIVSGAMTWLRRAGNECGRMKKDNENDKKDKKSRSPLDPLHDPVLLQGMNHEAMAAVDAFLHAADDYLGVGLLLVAALRAHDKKHHGLQDAFCCL